MRAVVALARCQLHGTANILLRDIIDLEATFSGNDAKTAVDGEDEEDSEDGR